MRRPVKVRRQLRYVFYKENKRRSTVPFRSYLEASSGTAVQKRCVGGRLFGPGGIVTGGRRTEHAAALRGRLVAAGPPAQLPALRRVQREALHPKVQLLTSRRVRRYNISLWASLTMLYSTLSPLKSWVDGLCNMCESKYCFAALGIKLILGCNVDLMTHLRF